jgi:hypothetical protein
MFKNKFQGSAALPQHGYMGERNGFNLKLNCYSLFKYSLYFSDLVMDFWSEVEIF